MKGFLKILSFLLTAGILFCYNNAVPCDGERFYNFTYFDKSKTISDFQEH